MSPVHTFTHKDLNLALDIGSGALHVIDGIAREAILMLQQGKTAAETARKLPHGEEVVAEILQLKAEGQLFAPVPPLPPWSPRPGEVKALCLHVAHSCNLRCSYCFASQGNFGGKSQLMPAPVGKQAVDFLLTASGPRRHLEIDFFGGEPLMNLPVVEDVIDYARHRQEESGKTFKFTLTTNGMLLDEKVGSFLNENNISVILSIDGREEVHDRFRRTPRGGGSFHRILPHLQQFVRRRNGEDYYLRGTFTKFNLDFSHDAEALLDMGFDRLSLEPVVAPPETEYALREEHLPVLEAEYDRLADLLETRRRQGKGFTFFHFNIDLDGGPCLAKRLSGCGAGRDYVAVTPEGEIYPCHQFVGQEQFSMGFLPEGLNSAALQRWDSTAPAMAAKKECRQCWARFFCGGGCHAAAYFQNGDMTIPYHLGCRLERKRLECALYLAAKAKIRI